MSKGYNQSKQHKKHDGQTGHSNSVHSNGGHTGLTNGSGALPLAKIVNDVVADAYGSGMNIDSQLRSYFEFSIKRKAEFPAEYDNETKYAILSAVLHEAANSEPWGLSTRGIDATIDKYLDGELISSEDLEEHKWLPRCVVEAIEYSQRIFELAVRESADILSEKAHTEILNKAQDLFEVVKRDNPGTKHLNYVYRDRVEVLEIYEDVSEEARLDLEFIMTRGSSQKSERLEDYLWASKGIKTDNSKTLPGGEKMCNWYSKMELSTEYAGDVDIDKPTQVDLADIVKDVLSSCKRGNMPLQMQSGMFLQGRDSLDAEMVAQVLKDDYSEIFEICSPGQAYTIINSLIQVMCDELIGLGYINLDAAQVILKDDPELEERLEDIKQDNVGVVESAVYDFMYEYCEDTRPRQVRDTLLSIYDYNCWDVDGMCEMRECSDEIFSLAVDAYCGKRSKEAVKKARDLFNKMTLVWDNVRTADYKYGSRKKTYEIFNNLIRNSEIDLRIINEPTTELSERLYRYIRGLYNSIQSGGDDDEDIDDEDIEEILAAMQRNGELTPKVVYI